MKKNFVFSLIVLMCVLCRGESQAQYAPPVFAIHVTSPTGFLYKGGLGVEYRIYPDDALLLNFSEYYNYFSGFQGSLEYRLYYNTHSVTENIIYFKAGTGFADYNTSPLYSGKDDMNKAPGTYYFGGAGVGKHFNFNVFFMEITAGLKFSYVTKPPAQYNQVLFYTLGPGSIPDVHFSFGLQF